jgi:hypothetical protein
LCYSIGKVLIRGKQIVPDKSRDLLTTYKKLNVIIVITFSVDGG